MPNIQKMKSTSFKTETPIIAHKPPERSHDEWQIWNIIEKNNNVADKEKQWNNVQLGDRTLNQSGGSYSS